MRLETNQDHLIRLLGSYGLDLNRYTSSLTESFLSRWPEPDMWHLASAQDALIATFAIGETTFLRHPEHFAVLLELLPELHRARGGKPVRAFSAGCSSGEEAYSLAATLASAGRHSFELRASDVNPQAIARAKQGEYRPWSLRGVDAQSTADWLLPAPCGVRVAPWLKELVAFRTGNLTCDPIPDDLDLIFCRNVLLYFTPAAAAQVFARFRAALRPGGYLFLGHHDPSPAREAGFRMVMRQGFPVYQRDDREQRSEAVLLSTRDAGVRSLAPPRPSLRPGRPLVATPTLAAQLEHVRALANQKCGGEALTLLQALSQAAPLMPELHILTALVAEETRDIRLMLEAARRACFLVPDQPAPNYFLSVAFLRSGELRRAALHRRIAFHALTHSNDTSQMVPYSEGLTVGQLRRLLGAVRR